MRQLWQALSERIWPSRQVGVARQSRHMTTLQAMLALVIILAWGPEMIAAMEMTALLELLGASLFITAYVSGFRLKAIELGRTLHSIVSPLGEFDLLRSSARANMKAVAATSALLNVVWCVGAFVVLAAFGQHLYAHVT